MERRGNRFPLLPIPAFIFVSGGSQSSHQLAFFTGRARRARPAPEAAGEAEEVVAAAAEEPLPEAAEAEAEAAAEAAEPRDRPAERRS